MGRKDAGGSLVRVVQRPEFKGGRVVSCRCRRSRLHRQNSDFQPSIGVPGIASAVFSLQLLKSVQPEGVLRHAGLLQSEDEPVTLGIQVGADVVGDLAGGMTQADALIKGDGAKPDLPAIVEPIPVPEPDMMTLAGAVAYGLLKGEVLLTAKQLESAHWSVLVRPAEH